MNITVKAKFNKVCYIRGKRYGLTTYIFKNVDKNFIKYLKNLGCDVISIDEEKKDKNKVNVIDIENINKEINNNENADDIFYKDSIFEISNKKMKEIEDDLKELIDNYENMNRKDLINIINKMGIFIGKNIFTVKKSEIIESLSHIKEIFTVNK